MILGSVMGRVS